jgi:hypothetical protein
LSGMIEYRVTKYDPRLRDPSGRYLLDEWTSAGDVGRPFGGVLLTYEEYRRVEDAYVALENHRRHPEAPLEGATLVGPLLEQAIRSILREEFWCPLEGGDCFLHFGWDYYMYVGVPGPCPEACLLATGSGLFVEPFRSPYREPV